MKPNLTKPMEITAEALPPSDFQKVITEIFDEQSQKYKKQKHEKIEKMAWELFKEFTLQAKERALFGTSGTDQKCGIPTNKEVVKRAYEEAEEFYDFAKEKQEGEE